MGDSTFPNEIWLNIFRRIDRPKLMEIRLVCHHFYDLIEDLLNRSPEWKNIAVDAILFECLTMTMQRAYPYDLVTHKNYIDDPVLWRGTYLSYKKWQKVLVNDYTIVPTSNFLNITCVCTFDKYIAIAFGNGSIANYTTDKISQPFYLAHHGTGINQVEFWYSNGDVLLVSLGIDNILKFWDLQNKTEILTNGFFATSISSGESRHFCIADMRGVLTSYERTGNHISPGPTLNLEFSDNDRKLIAHTIDGIYMSAMAYDKCGTVKYLCRLEIESGRLTELVPLQESDWYHLPYNLMACHRRLTIPTCTFFFGISGYIIGSTNYYDKKWLEYNLGMRFGCNVSSIALHAQILMLGLEDGSIHMLYIEHYGYVRELENRIQHSKKIEVDTVPIVGLTILEVDKKPCIVAVTEQRVHFVNFF